MWWRSSRRPLIVDEIHKAQLRATLRDAQQKIEAAQNAASTRLRNDAARGQARQSRIDELNAQIRSAESEFRDADQMLNRPIDAATRKEEVEKSDRRYKEAKRIEAKLIDLRPKLAEESR